VFESSLQPALRRYRLVVLDQRGTGRSGALNCPSVQGLRALDSFRPPPSARARNGSGRAAPSSRPSTPCSTSTACAPPSARPRVALMGISYGTHVALQYARAFPSRVDRLILDSIVGPDGPDALLLDSVRALPRVLREQCAVRRCRGITSDPVADVAAVGAQLRSSPLRGAGVRPQRPPPDRVVPVGGRAGLPAALGRPEPVPAGGAAGAIAAARGATRRCSCACGGSATGRARRCGT
jgi:pimeloyl-ACP methyl ester carboxylesterase